jgi:hypothetical protein
MKHTQCLYKFGKFLCCAAVFAVAGCNPDRGKENVVSERHVPPVSLSASPTALDVDAADANCDQPAGWQSVVEEIGSAGLIAFGEVHGASEMPAMVAEFACALAYSTDKSVVVLYEIDSFQNDVFKRLPEISPDAREKEILSSNRSFWGSSSGDGRRSHAILDSITRVARVGDERPNLQVASLGVDLFQLAEAGGSMVKFREMQFANLLQYVDRHDYVVTLTGTVHAINIAKRASAKDELNSLAVYSVYGGGRASNCMERCGVNTMPENSLYVSLSGYRNQLRIDKDLVGTFGAFYVVDSLTPAVLIKDSGLEF